MNARKKNVLIILSLFIFFMLSPLVQSADSGISPSNVTVTGEVIVTVGGGGGGALIVSSYLCNLTSNLTNQSRESEKVLVTKKYANFTNKSIGIATVYTYITYWQLLCSDIPKIICNEIYYYAVGKADRLTINDTPILVGRIRLEESIDITSTELENYIGNYREFCIATNLSDELPQEKLGFSIIDIIEKLNLSDCSPSLNNSYFDATFPPKSLGFNLKASGIECETINILRWFLSYDKIDDENYYFRGVRIYFVLIILGIIYTLILTNKKVNKLFKKLFRKKKH